MTPYVPGTNDETKARLDAIRSKYPFLEQIIASQHYGVFNIEEAVIDAALLGTKSHDHGSEGPESFDMDFYAVCNGVVRELPGGLERTITGSLEPGPAMNVGEALISQRITPDYLVSARHLKYEIDGEHHHDVSLKVYKMTPTKVQPKKQPVGTVL